MRAVAVRGSSGRAIAPPRCSRSYSTKAAPTAPKRTTDVIVCGAGMAGTRVMIVCATHKPTPFALRSVYRLASDQERRWACDCSRFSRTAVAHLLPLHWYASLLAQRIPWMVHWPSLGHASWRSRSDQLGSPLPNQPTECYRNWWPDSTMMAYVNRSIGILEELAVQR